MSPWSANTPASRTPTNRSIEALVHGGIANKVKVNLQWIESQTFEQEDASAYLEDVHGILVPGGFGERGSEGKIRAARYARERGVPYFGICFGMQMAVIEVAARSRRHRGAQARPSSARPPEPVIGLMTEWMKGAELEKRQTERQSRRHHAARRL